MRRPPRPGLILFDLGDVACRFVPARRLAALARSTGLGETEIEARIWGSGLEGACERGELSPLEAVTRVSAALGRPMNLDTLGAVWALAFEPNPQVLAIVDDARGRLPTGLLTNNGPFLLHALPTTLPEIAQRFDPVLFSCRLRALKPAPTLYAAVAEAVGRPAHELLLIDDASANVEGALAAGWQGLRYRDPTALRRELFALLEP